MRRLPHRLTGLLRLTCLLALLACLGLAFATSYTVQVVAVSDERKALELLDTLQDEGYPAYLLTVPTAQGSLVYRLRVGAFTNRAAAESYADAMPEVGGSRPLPALAENIPTGLIALEPELITRFRLNATKLQVLPWGESVALRVQSLEPLREAHYLLPDGSDLKAWRAAPQADNTLLYTHDLPLWPENWQALSGVERAAYRQGVVATVATSLGVSAAEMGAFVSEDEPPSLTLVEQLEPDSGSKTRLRALGRPATEKAASGPELEWLEPDGARPLADPEPLFTLSTDAAPRTVQGDGWSAEVSGTYSELHTALPDQAWRAVVGAPLWAQGDLLITRLDNDIFVYRFAER